MVEPSGQGTTRLTEGGVRQVIVTVALTGCLVAGAAAASILMRDSVQMAGAAIPSPVIQNAAHPLSNWENKGDRLAVRLTDSAALELTTGTLSPESPPQGSAEAVDPAPARQAAAPTKPAKANPVKAETAPAVVKSALAKPVSQKPEPLLSDGQIAGIKERLKLSSGQEYYWPAVESALRAVGRKINAGRSTNANANAGAPLIDPDAAEVQQLKFAAMPLLFQLREDQKREVRSLARLMGLEQVAAQI